MTNATVTAPSGHNSPKPSIIHTGIPYTTTAAPSESSTASSQKNMYKVGDFVYFENSAANPYLIRRIEEIIKTDAGVNVKAQSYSRRRDIPTSLIQLADKHVRELEEELYESQWPSLDELKKHQLQHRELYMTRPSGQDLLPATQIRGKCDVILLGPTDDVDGDYLGKEHNYFYTLVYDQSQRTVVTDRGDIRSGPGYQVEIPETLSSDQRTNKDDGRDLSELETLTFDPERLGETRADEKNSDPEKLSETDLDRFLTVSKSVGTFARALDATASTVQPILTVSASMASRDCTTQWAMDCMHEAGYDLGDAVRNLVTEKGPVLVRDQLECWSPSEAQLFEDGIDRYGKEFGLIRNELLPWKSYASIIEFYYMWKASDRYLSYKRTKATDQEKKLKQVYIPKFDKASPNQLTPTQLAGVSRPCEGCCTLESENWYTWGPSTLTCRLCDNCWDYWKKYGGLKMPQTQRIELMAKQQKKLPGQNDEKKGSLRNSTKLVTIEKEREREEKEEEKKKKKEKEGGEKSGDDKSGDDKSGGDKSDRDSPVIKMKIKNGDKMMIQIKDDEKHGDAGENEGEVADDSGETKVGGNEDKKVVEVDDEDKDTKSEKVAEVQTETGDKRDADEMDTDMDTTESKKAKLD